MINTEITAARIGRSMNSLENPMAVCPLAAGERLDASVSRRDPGTRPDALHAVDHDAVVALHSGADDAEASLEIARLDDTLLGDVVVAQDPHESARLVAQDRAVGHEQGFEFARADELHASKLAGGEESTGVRDECATAYRARRRVELVVHEVHLADVRERGLVEQPDAHGIRHIA